MKNPSFLLIISVKILIIKFLIKGENAKILKRVARKIILPGKVG
jgi:hypothetical protein